MSLIQSFSQYVQNDILLILCHCVWNYKVRITFQCLSKMFCIWQHQCEMSCNIMVIEFYLLVFNWWLTILLIILNIKLRLIYCVSYDMFNLHKFNTMNENCFTFFKFRFWRWRPVFSHSSVSLFQTVNLEILDTPSWVN